MMNTFKGRIVLVMLLILPGMSMLHDEAQAFAAPVDMRQFNPGAYEHRDGLLPLYVDKKGGRVFVVLPPAGENGIMSEVIHHVLLAEGGGSMLTRLDRGQFGPSRILQFNRVGSKVVAKYKNVSFIASGGEQEQSATDAAFADSVVWIGDIAEERSDGSVVVDMSSFLTRDANNMARILNGAGIGRFKQSPSLSLVLADRAKAFQDNDEFDAMFTFEVDAPKSELSGLVPDPRNFTVILHHSFIRLPDDGYVTREFDPRVAQGEVLVTDYSAPLGKPLVRHLARRFRLEKTDPSSPRSTVKKPIVFYVDNSAPEPIRSALVEGASWWKQAFDAAGFIDAYKVEVLPKNVDPMDARYNVIFWVHRQTRSWSYGQTVTDPRTGEIVRGSVLLGSQRIRQNIIQFENLFGVAADGKGVAEDPIEIALARARQLAAHEVGHALGFQHNFAASSQGRTSVMDYPIAKISLKNGRLDASDAYAVGIGDWDKLAIDALYGDSNGLKERIALGTSKLRFGADIDGRSDATGLAANSSWDNGENAAVELQEMMDVRRYALAKFGLGNLLPGEPVNNLRRRIVPLYLYHRYQVAAAAKLIGGAVWGYPVNGGGNEGLLKPVPYGDQILALDSLLRTISPRELVLRPDLLKLLAAQNTGAEDPQNTSELIAGRIGRDFDMGMAVETAAEISLSAMLAPERLNRLVEAEARDPNPLGIDEYLGKLIDYVFSPSVSNKAEAEAARRIQLRTVLMLARNANGVPLTNTPGAIAPRKDKFLSATALSVVNKYLLSLSNRLKKSHSSDPIQLAHDQWLASMLSSPKEMKLLLESGRYDIRIPPGEPI